MNGHAQLPKSSPPRLIAICQHPHGDGLWFELEPGRERCPEVGCDCSPALYVLAEPTDEMVERGAHALEHWADAWGQPARREAAARAVLVAALSTTGVGAGDAEPAGGQPELGTTHNEGGKR